MLLVMLASAIVIARPNLTTQNKRNIRLVTWSNDAMSTLLDLYEKKYLVFGCRFFLTKD
jgi:hypothetical protein